MFDSRTGRQIPQHFQDPQRYLTADAFLNGLFWTVREPGYVGERVQRLVLRVPVFVFHNFGLPVYRHSKIRIAKQL